MAINIGDVYQAMMPADEGNGAPRQPVAGYAMTILAIDGEAVRYQRMGSRPTDTTLSVLQASIDRGDLLRVNSGE